MQRCAITRWEQWGKRARRGTNGGRRRIGRSSRRRRHCICTRPESCFAVQLPSEKDGGSAFRADPTHPNVIPGPSPGFPGAIDAQAFEAEAEVRTFTTDVLTEPVEWTGKVQTELFVSSTAPDTDFIVRISDVYPDGRSILLIDYVRRARYREGYEKEVMMEPGKVYKVAFDVGWLSQIFNRGHRIRVTVASTGAPFYEPNPNTGESLTTDPPAKTVVAENVVHHHTRGVRRGSSPRGSRDFIWDFGDFFISNLRSQISFFSTVLIPTDFSLLLPLSCANRRAGNRCLRTRGAGDRRSGGCRVVRIGRACWCLGRDPNRKGQRLGDRLRPVDPSKILVPASLDRARRGRNRWGLGQD